MASRFPVRPPGIFGIVNITEDSFSDGGRYLNPASAIEHARALVNNGAMAVDLGAAASNPKARPVSPDDEIRRLAPVVKALKQDEIRVSVDTFSPEVQRWAMAQGVAYLNDIEGFADPSFFPELACGSAGLIVMHSVQGRGRATAIDVRPEEIFDRISQFFEQRIGALTSAGIDRSRLILDPGMGFFVGTDPQTSFSVLRQLPALKQAFGMPLLLSVSRKSFLRLTTGRGLPEIGPATLACELFAVMQGADYIRTHDPGALADGLRVLEAATARNRT